MKFHFTNEIKSCLASPFNDKSYDLLVVHNYKHRSHQTFCRYSEKGELLWTIREDSFWSTHFPLTHFSSEFILFAPKENTFNSPKAKLIFTNLSDGKVYKILTMPELVHRIVYVELQASLVAIQVVCFDRSADVYIYDWRSGVMLTKVSQFLEKPVIQKNSEGKEVMINQVGCYGINLGRVDYYLSDDAKGWGKAIIVS